MPSTSTQDCSLPTTSPPLQSAWRRVPPGLAAERYELTLQATSTARPPFVLRIEGDPRWRWFAKSGHNVISGDSPSLACASSACADAARLLGLIQ
jgi:hypothetical protein